MTELETIEDINTLNLGTHGTALSMSDHITHQSDQHDFNDSDLLSKVLTRYKHLITFENKRMSIEEKNRLCSHLF